MGSDHRAEEAIFWKGWRLSSARAWRGCGEVEAEVLEHRHWMGLS